MSSVLGTYARKDISFKEGKGSYLFAENGDRYLDFVQGIGTNILGHCHEHLVKAIEIQSKKLWHVSNAFIIPEQERLAKRLTENTFADFVCFQNSGTEATEASIKIARKYFHKIGKPEKNRIITFQGAFHGRTLAALFAANNPKHTEGFGPKVDGFDQVPFADHEAVKKAINKNTAAIMIETIMGEGGIKVVPDFCIKGLRDICDEHEILLILDEVQCAYRTGDFFAFEKSGIIPDIVPIAKGIGGGFPLGACLVTKKVSVGMTAGTHGSTFGGNPLAMSVGNAVLDTILKKGFLEDVKKKGKYFDEGLNKVKKKYPKIIGEIRGIGLIKGLKVLVDNVEFIKKLMNHKILTVKAEENVIRLFPPLIVQQKELDEAISKIEKVCEELS
jgi:acetylornithine/N-succinyldiaminopimelate aminotransferase|tara:strand:- start:761 stop:1924 length:1164 start_codon:yes stop_codon:yes gene_type:complete